MRNTNCSLILSDYELNIPVIEVSNLDNLSIYKDKEIIDNNNNYIYIYDIYIM